MGFKGSVMNPIPGRNPCRFGEIPEFPVGSMWPGRRELCDDGIHANLTKGIHGRGEEGAFSVVLSGGYEDDVDLGEEFTYTGQGGQAKREPGVKWDSKQITDQEWKFGNLALQTSSNTKEPVRVIRGHKLKSDFAPAEGYRYDGLYTVEEATMKVGKSGHAVCLFRFVVGLSFIFERNSQTLFLSLKRCPGQLPLPTKVATMPMRRERPLTLQSSPQAPVASSSRRSPDRATSSSDGPSHKQNDIPSGRPRLGQLSSNYKILKRRHEPSIANYKSSRPQSSMKVEARASSELSRESFPLPSVRGPSSSAQAEVSSQISVQDSETSDLQKHAKEEPETETEEITKAQSSEADEDDNMHAEENIGQLAADQDQQTRAEETMSEGNLANSKYDLLRTEDMINAASEDLEDGEIADAEQ